MLFQNNEKRDLQRIPYARAGCYFYINEDYFCRQLKLIFVYAQEIMQHGNVAFWLDMLKDGQAVRYNYFGDEGSLRLVTADQDVALALTGENQIRFRGNRGAAFRLRLSSINEEAPAEALQSAVMLENGDFEIYFGHYGYMRFKALCGSMRVDCRWDDERETYACCDVVFEPDEAGCFEAVLHDYRGIFTPVTTYPAFQTVVDQNQKSFRDFFSHYRRTPEKYRQLTEDCVYEIWSHYMKADAFVRSPMIMFQYICLASSFAWQQSFNGMAMQANPRFGFELITNLFQYQEPDSGLLPANVNSGYINYDGAQPPLQGMALNLLVKQCGEESLPVELSREVLPKFERWIEYWVTYRTAGRGDDVIQINNPNEAGWDDTTVFSGVFPAADADMQALLAECMFACALLARRCGQAEKASLWNARGERLVKTILTEFWDGTRFITKIGGADHTSESFAVFMPLILGDRLPKAVVDKCVESLFAEGAYMTPMGLCSESMKSPLCTWGGAHFVSGRVVAPVQLIISLGLWRAGRKKEARHIAEAWCDTVAERGVRLGFKPYEINPLTGIPAPAILEPQPSDSWSWASWSACCTMTMLETILAEDCEV